MADKRMNRAKINQAEYCKKCRKKLCADEIAATKKLINRGSEVFFCIDCLAQAFEVSRTDIEEKIQYFKDSGCTLFTLQETENNSISGN